MCKLLHFINLGLLALGLISCFLSFNLVFDLNLYRIKNEVGDTEKIYIIDENRASKEMQEIEESEEEEGFNIINFIERLNGDFKFDY